MPGTTTVLTNPTSVVALDKINRLSNDELDQVPIGVIELDANGTICFYNATEAKMSGRDAKKVVGKNFSMKSRLAQTFPSLMDGLLLACSQANSKSSSFSTLILK